MESWKPQTRNRIPKRGRKFITVEEWELKQWVKFEPRSWLNLPSDVMAMIFTRLTAVEILENAQFVCSSWRQISKDPLVWKCIDTEQMFEDVMDICIKYRQTRRFYRRHMRIVDKLTKQAVDRSCGQLVDLNLHNACCEDLNYVADRSPRLTRLRLVYPYGLTAEGLIRAVSKLPLLTFFDITIWEPERGSESVIEAIGRCCPLLRSFRLNRCLNRYFTLMSREENNFYGREYGFLNTRRTRGPGEADYHDKYAFAIASSMPGLRHLKLIGSEISNRGLEAILDGCTRLVSLDLRGCYYIELEGDIGKRCFAQISDVRGPSLDRTDHWPDEISEKRWYWITMYTRDGSVYGGSYSSDTCDHDHSMSRYSDDYDKCLDYEYIEASILGRDSKRVHRETRDLNYNSYLPWF